MSEQAGASGVPEPAAMMAEGLDAVLAVLLLSRRVHVEKLSVDGAARARVELSGEAVAQGLATLAQVMTMVPPRKARVQGEEDAGAEENPGTVWQALKDFALPPPVKPRKKKQ